MTLVEQTIRNRARNIGLTLEQLAVLCDVRKQRLIPGLGGRLTLTIPELEKINRCLDRVNRLVEALAPIPLDMKHTATIEFLLDALDDGSLPQIFSEYRDVLAQGLERHLARAY